MGTSELISLLDPDHVLMVRRPLGKEELIRVMVERLAALDGLAEPDAILAEILGREEENSTGVGRAVAIPHCTSRTDRDHLLVCRVEPPVPFHSVDGQPVRLAFLILTPWARQALYLRLLAEIARLTRDPALLSQLWEATDAPSLLSVLTRVSEPRTPTPGHGAGG